MTNNFTSDNHNPTLASSAAQPRKGNADYINEFLLEMMTVQQRSANTIQSYYYDLAALLKWNLLHEKRHFFDFDLDYCRKYFYTPDSQAKATSSLSRQGRAFMSFFKFLIKKGYLSKNPIQFLVLPQEKNNQRQALTVEEFEELVSLCDLNTRKGTRLRAMIEFIYATGLRASELILLQFGEIDFTRGTVTVQGKGGKVRSVPFSHRSLFYLQQWLNQYRYQETTPSEYVFTGHKARPMTRSYFWQELKKLAVQAGIDFTGFGPHTLRHTFATHLLQNGSDLRSLQLFLGHASIDTTQIYTHLADGEVLEQYRKLELQQQAQSQEILQQMRNQYATFRQRD